jgi:hypothetical protein
MVRLVSVNVGLPRDVTWNGKTVRTAIWKTPVVGRQMARKLDVVGDAQADLAGHGGEQRAVFVYQMDAFSSGSSFSDVKTSSSGMQGLAEFVPSNAPTRLAIHNYGGKSGTRR